MGREVATASIVLLIGTSTAGKSTIVGEILRQNAELPEESRMDWQVNGTDLAHDRYKITEKLDAFYLDLLKDDVRFQRIIAHPLFAEIDGKNPFVARMPAAIFCNKLSIEGHELSLENEDSYGLAVDDFIAATGGIYTREMLDDLFLLAKDRHQEFLDKKMSWEV